MSQEDIRRQFSARLLDLASVQKALDEGAKVGEADIALAAFRVPDTGIAAGNIAPQVIDKGAFARFSTERDFTNNPFPTYVDHGDYINLGYTNSQLKIGYAADPRETDQAFIMRFFYNLEKEVARDAFSDLVFDPLGTQFSFRNWKSDEVLREGDDGFTHVVEFRDLIEGSQVGFGAQRLTGPIPGSITARQAIPSHSTDTYEGQWNGPKMVGMMSGDASKTMLRKMFAWVDPSGDPTAKSSYKFPHHTVENGMVGGANVAAARAVIANLNGSRTAPKIPPSDRQGVYNHVARHLKDAGVENVPTLRTEMPDADEMAAWAEESEEFRDILRTVAEAHEVGTGKAAIDVPGSFAEAMADEARRAAFIEELKGHPETSDAIRALIDEATKAEETGESSTAAKDMLDTIWKGRREDLERAKA